MTKGATTQYYLARRYFRYSVEEWDALPWWQSALYLEGLKEQGIIGGDSGRSAAGQPGKPATRPVDYAEDMVLPKGFTTRRAG